MTKNLGGRPRKELTQKQVYQMEALTAFGYSQKTICDYISKDEEGPVISDRTFIEIKKRTPEVSSAYDKGKENLEERAIKRLSEHMDDKINAAVSLKATIFTLEAQCNWSSKQIIETKDTTPKEPQELLIKFDDDADNKEA